VYVLAMAAVLANMFVTQTTEALIAVGFIAVGAVVYAVMFGGVGAKPQAVTSPADPAA
jgi:hypothetical protein